MFFNYGIVSHNGLTQNVLDYSATLAWRASPLATVKDITAFSATDFRPDMAKFDIPTLVVHGDADQVVPFEASGKRTAEMIPGAQLEVLEGAPHGFYLTHAEQLNELLVKFISS